MRARKNFSYRALLSLQSAPIPRKGKRPSLNLGDDTNFFAQFECAPLSSIIRRGVSPPTSFFWDQRKHGSLAFSPPHAGQFCLVCALLPLARRPGGPGQGAAPCR